MSGRNRFVLRLAAALICLLAALLTPRATLALPKAAVTSRLELAGTPTPGGSARVIWAGVPDQTPSAATLALRVTGPDRKTQRYTQAIQLKAGRAADATLTFPTPQAGRYRVTARLTLTVQGVLSAKENELLINVAPPKIPSRKPRAAASPHSVAPGQMFLSSKPMSKTKNLALNGVPVDGNIDSGDDEDWYQFDLDTTHTVILMTLETGSLDDSVMDLYGPNDKENQIDENDDIGDGCMSALQEELGPGAYYVKITGYHGDDYDCTGTYSIIGFDASETTQTLTVDGDVSYGIFNPDSGEKWYTFTVKDKDDYSIETYMVDGSYYDTQIELFGPGNTTTSLDWDEDGGLGYFSLINKRLNPGTYYVKVTSDDWDFMFGIKVAKGFRHTPVTLKTDGSQVKGSIDHTTDYNWYQFTVDRAGDYSIGVKAGSMRSIQGYFYKTNDTGEREEIDSGDNYADEGEMVLDRDYLLVPGTYWIKIESSNDDDEDYPNTGDYHISVATLGIINQTPISLNTPTPSGDVASDSEQWLTLEITTAGDYTFFVPFLSTGTQELKLTLYDSKDLGNDLMSQWWDDNHPAITTTYLDPGVYYLRLNYFRDDGTGPGRYQVSILNYAVSQFDLYNSPTVELAAVGAANWMAFFINDANVYTVEIANGTLAGQTATLYGPNIMASQLAQVTATGKGRTSQITKFLQPGMYFVKVQSTAGSGNYTIHLKTTYANLSLSADPRNSVISTAGAMDIFYVDISTTTSYTFEAFSGTLTGAVMRIYGPNDNTKYLTKNVNSGMSGMPKIVTTLTPGRYYLAIQGGSPSASGTYSIWARNTYTYMYDIPAYNTATIRYSGDAAYYSFQVDQPAKYTISTTPGTLKHNYLLLYGPGSDTRLIARNGLADAHGLARITATLQPGTYYLKLQGLSAADVGECQLQVCGTYHPLTMDGPTTTETLSWAGEVKTYQFQVDTAASYSIETESAPPAPGVTGTYMLLYGPDRDTTYLGRNTGSGSMGRLEKVLKPGTYYLTVQGRTGADVGNFLLRVRHTYTPLTLFGQPAPGFIADRNDIDWYTFHIDTAADYLIETRAVTLADDFIMLYDAAKPSTPLAKADNFADQKMARLTRHLAPGDYIVAVWGVNAPNNLGRYTIRLGTPIQPVAVNGAPIVGAVDSTSEVDWYTFTVTTTTTYRVETFAGTTTDTYIRLYGPGNMTNLIGWNATYGPGQMGKVVMSLTPGQYYAQVRSGFSGALGTYLFQVRTNGAVTLKIDDPNWYSAYISPPGDIDWYTFTVATQGYYDILLEGGTMNDLYAYLYGPDNQTTMVDQFRLLSWRYEYLTPGTYTLRVQATNPAATGSYSLKVETD